MKFEDVRIGQLVVTARGKIGQVKKTYPTGAVEIKLLSGGRSLPYAEKIEPYQPFRVEELISETIEAFARKI